MAKFKKNVMIAKIDKNARIARTADKDKNALFAKSSLNARKNTEVPKMPRAARLSRRSILPRL